MKLWGILARRSVTHLIQIAAVLALVGLAVIVFSILFPRPLSVVFAMSVGHVIGASAFACYLLAVIIDVSRTRPPETQELHVTKPEKSENLT